MIFAVTIISVLAFALTNIFAKKMWHTALSIVFALLFIVSLCLITANDHYHYGMKKVTDTTTQALTSSADNKNMNMLLYQPLGNGTEKVYIYKTNEAQKKAKTTGTEHVTNVVKENQTKSQLETKKTYWVYTNDTAKLWFSLSSKDQKATMETEAKAYVQEQVKAAMMKNPKMDQAEQQKVIKQATAEYQQQAMAKMIAQAKK